MADVNLTIKSDSKRAQAGIDRYNAKVKNLDATFGALGDESGRLRAKQSALFTEIKKVAGTVGTSGDRFKQLVSEYKKVRAESQKLATSQKRVGISLKSVITAGAGIAATVASVRALSRSFTGTFTSSREFTKQIKNVKTLTNDLSFNTIRKGILALDPVLGTTTELTEGLYNALSAGVPASKAIAFVGESAKFAKAGLVGANDAVKLISVSMNAYGKASYSAGKTSDIFFKTIKQGITTGAELAQNFGQVLPIFSAMDVKLEEVSASFATLTKGGLNSAEAATALKAVATAFLKPSEAMTKAIEDTEHASASALIKAEGLAGALEFLSDASKGNEAELARLLPNVRALQGALILAKDSGLEYTTILSDMADSTGAVDKAFDAQIDAIDRAEGAFRKLQVSVGIVVEELSMKLAPVAQKIAETLLKIDFTALAVSIGAVGAALGTYTILSKGATVATLALSKAFKASVIGAVLSGIAFGVYKVIDAYNEYQTLLGNKGEPPSNLLEVNNALKTVSESIAEVQAELARSQKQASEGWDVNDKIKNQKKLINDLVVRWEDLYDLKLKFEEKEKESSDADKQRVKDAKDAAATEAKAQSAKMARQSEIQALIASTTVSQQNATTERIQQLQTLLASEDLSAKQILQVEQNLAAQREILDRAAQSRQDAALARARVVAQAQAQALTQYYSEVNSAMSDLIDTTLGGYATMFSAVAALSTSFTADVLADAKKVAAQALEAFSGMLRGIGEVVGDALAQENAQRAEQEEAALEARNEKRERAKEEAETEIADRAEREKSQVKNSVLTEREKAQRLTEIDKAKSAALKANADKFEAQKKADAKKVAQEQYARDVSAFNTQKGFKIAQTLADTAVAIVKVWANNIDPTFTLPAIMSAVIGGISAAQIGVISAQKPPPAPKFAMGGRVEVPSGFDDDNFPINVRSGEAVTIDPAPDEDESERQIIINIAIGDEILQRAIRSGIENGTINVRF